MGRCTPYREAGNQYPRPRFMSRDYGYLQILHRGLERLEQTGAAMKIIRTIGKWVMTNIVRDPYFVQVKRWSQARGDETLRTNHPLTAKSLVFDVGAYRGDFAHRIRTTFNCSVWAFEPVAQFAAEVRNRFRDDPRVSVFQFGLASTAGELVMHQCGDGSSTYRRRKSSASCVARMAAIADVVAKVEGDVDLAEINIEGGEYDLVPTLLEHASKFRRLQIQFHHFVPGAAEKRAAIRAALSLTHRELWCFPFVWEAWERFDLAGHTALRNSDS